MASVGTYLNFPRNAEQAFLFYRSVFGGEFTGDGIMRKARLARNITAFPTRAKFVF
jgi:predicted enzyme related to lactoylglutathione lyase